MRSSEMLEYTYQSSRCHNSEDHKHYRHENLKSVEFSSWLIRNSDHGLETIVFD